MSHQFQNDAGAAIMSERECWELLSGATLGRLATSVDGRPEIFPVNYIVQHKTILFRTAGGTKLVSAAINNQVVFEVDDHTVLEGWSVVVKGTARSVRTDDDIAEAERAHLLTWTESDKPHFMRVLPDTVTGRRFQFIPERQQDVVSKADVG